MIYLKNQTTKEVRAYEVLQNDKLISGLISGLIADGWIKLDDAAFAAWREPAQAAALVAATKARRLTLLADTDPIANRDNRQNAALTSAQVAALAAKGKAITPAQRKELETYTQALRDLPEAVKAWPAVKDTDWPAKPSWLDAMSKRTGAQP